MSNPPDTTSAEARNVAHVERFLAAFTRRWPSGAELDELLAPDVRLVDRPNLLNPRGGDRDAAAVRAGIEAGKALLAWQAYEVRDHVARGDLVVSRLCFTGELAIDAGDWPRGTLLRAWCVAHYRFADGRIAEIEQHDAYEAPVPPAASGGQPSM